MEAGLTRAAPEIGRESAKRRRVDHEYLGWEVGQAVQGVLAMDPAGNKTRRRIGVVSSTSFSSSVFLAATQLGLIAWIASSTGSAPFGNEPFRTESFVPATLESASSVDQMMSLLIAQPVDILVFDGLRPPSFTHELWSMGGLAAVLVFGKMLKRVTGSSQAGWKVSSCPLVHSSFGGVTGWRTNLTVALRRPSQTVGSLGLPQFEPIGVRASLSQLVDWTAKGGISCPPLDAKVFEASMEMVPVDRIRAVGCRFVLPSVFAKTGFV